MDPTLRRGSLARASRLVLAGALLVAAAPLPRAAAQCAM
jgi:hypothetical protein